MKTLEAWRAEGAALIADTRAAPWKRGDWYNHGLALVRREHDPRQELTDAQASALLRQCGDFLANDAEWKTFRNAAVVCKAFAPARRRERLTFAHHETVAALAPREQARWLDRCEKETLTVADLRQSLREKLRPATVHPVNLYVLPAEVSRMLRWLGQQDLARDPDRRAAIRDALKPLVEFADSLG